MKKGCITGIIGLLIALVIFASAMLSAAGCAAGRERRRQETPTAAAPEQGGINTPGTERKNTNPAPDFTVKDLEGNNVRFSSLFGKPIVLNFWATWCSPCRMELPDFEEMYAEYGGKVQFMMVNVEGGSASIGDINRFIKDNGFAFPVYFDATNLAAEAYNLSGIPMSYFIDTEGNIVSMHRGLISKKQLEKEIAKLLPQLPTGFVP